MVKNGNIEVKRILNVLREKALLIILVLIVSILLGYAYSFYYVVPEYKSTATLLLIPNNDSEEQTITSSDLTLNSGLISTYSSIAKQSRVLKQVIENLNLNMTETELQNKLQISVLSDTYIIQISVSDTSAQKAADIANELSTVFLKEIKEIYNLENIGIVDKAETALTPYNINHVKDIILFAGGGIIISCCVILGIMIFDNTVKTEEDIEEYTGIKALGKIPVNLNKKQEIASKENAKSYITECINTIRTNILYMNSVKTAKTILVTSCKAQEGKSWVSSNIATSFAETNKKVLLIDADLRKGRTSKIFNVDNKEGLSNYLYYMTGNIGKDLELAKKYIKETAIPNLHILTNGNVPPNPAELLESSNMIALLAMLKGIYDIIIIDSAPCMLVTDSIVLSTIVDSAILVVNSENTKIKDVLEVKKSIEMVGGNLIGAILNKVKIEGKIYSKSYYYGHAKTENKCELKQREIISVEELVDNAVYQMQLTNVAENNSKNEEIKEEIKQDSNNVKIQDNSHELAKIANSISELKTELNKNKRKFTSDDVRKIIQKEIQSIDYENKLNKLEEMLLDLNNNYLELSNRLKDKGNSAELEEIEEPSKNTNVVSINLFRKQAKKKKSYSIKEDINYKDLEETAFCVIPFEQNNFSEDIYESLAVR